MVDNQIVISILDNPDELNQCPRQLGDRYIVKKDERHLIAEYNGSEWIYEKTNMNPKNIFVLNPKPNPFATTQNNTVILYNEQIWNQYRWFICSKCEKLTSNKLKSVIGAVELCIHCFFKKNYDNPDRSAFPMTIGAYIKKYAITHNSTTCSNQSRCFLCHFKQGKIMANIEDIHLVYPNGILSVLRANKFDIQI